MHQPRPRQEAGSGLHFAAGVQLQNILLIHIQTRALERKSYGNLYNSVSHSGDDRCKLQIFNYDVHYIIMVTYNWKAGCVYSMPQLNVDNALFLSRYSFLIRLDFMVTNISSQSCSSNRKDTTTTLEATEQHTALNVWTLQRLQISSGVLVVEDAVHNSVVIILLSKTSFK